MATTIRPEVSEKNKYWIERHRYYELKHFCLQYPMWRKAYAVLDGFEVKPKDQTAISKKGIVADPTEKCAELRLFYRDRMGIVERAAEETDAVLGKYVLKGVTEGLSYDILKAKLEIPCCKDTYYTLYRRFFWLLSKARQ